MFKSKLVFRIALPVMLVLSFVVSGGRVFADDTTAPTDNTVAATNSSDQSAAVASASVNPDPVINNDQSNSTPDTSTGTPPADPATTDGTGTANGADQQPSAVAPVCPTTPSDPTQGTQPAVTPDPTTGSQTTATNNLGIDNNICSGAGSGNASVTGNANGGNATSGNADATATLMNIIQSLTGLTGSDLATFVQNIPDHNGDITIDPSLLGSLLGGGCSLCGGGNSLNSNVNSTINNNINLGANSGNADVSDNGSGGNATTGDATALLNLINIINSIIASNKSFIGIINIDGNLNGDILLPPDLLSALLASNSPPSDSSGSGGSSGGGSQFNSDNTQGINNNINLSATSGNADVSGNGSGGNATTGNAQTKLTLLNLTGSQIIGQNALLVFINVLGTWMGMIVNAPAGTTAAALGDATSTGGTCGCSGLNVNSTTNSQINNNINLSAATGNASVTGNGSGGNATSGNATASANIVNIINSDISLTGWFGILFINVFGTWDGSFGIDTAAGDPVVVPPAPTGDSGSGQGSAGPTVTTASASTGSGTNNGFGAGSTAGGQGTSSNNDNNQTNVLGATTNGSGPSAAASNSSANFVIGIVGGLCCFMLLGSVERRQRKHNQPLAPIVPEVLTNQWM